MLCDCVPHVAALKLRDRLFTDWTAKVGKGIRLT
jgi:hypothetical protein